MSAAEVLKHAMALSPRERTKLVQSLLAQAGERAKVPKKKPSRAREVTWPNIVARAREVTGGRILPNLVQLERDERGF